MPDTQTSRLSALIHRAEGDILEDWMRHQLSTEYQRRDLMGEGQLREQSRRFLGLLGAALDNGAGTDIRAPAWSGVRDFLAELSHARARQGLLPSEMAAFVMSLKQPLFERLRQWAGDNIERFDEEVWATTVLVDRLALFTTEIHQRGRDEVIQRQQQELLELSTPVVELWEGILALPLIGTLDSARTQIVMESLLQRIVETRAGIAIIDITGVPMVDTLVAQHLLKTVGAARLMGADCIISGIRPQIAQTIVHLGVELSNVTTKATMADAFAQALRRSGLTIVPLRTAPGG